MNLEDIHALIEEFDHSSIMELSLDMSGVQLHLSKREAQPYSGERIPNESKQETASVDTIKPVVEVVDTPSSNQENVYIVKSPIVGIVYLAPAPNEPVYAPVGATVNEQQTVCIIEAMKLMNEIQCGQSGMIQQVLVENGQMVEYDQPLFAIQLS